MNAGELNDKLSILSLTSTVDGTSTVYTWSVSDEVWAKAETPDMYNAFSRVGKSERTVKFTIRKRDLALTNAILWQEKHCFLTHIADVGRQYCSVTAALIEPVTCTAITYGYTLNQLNRPGLTQTASMTFPGFLTEQHIAGEGYEQKKPMAETTERFVLVTPKVITLETGAIVQAGVKQYTVTAAHKLDSYQNEYEIMKKEDA